MPTSPATKYEIEFAVGTWTDVTADVDYSAGHSIRLGRTTPTGQPQTSTVSIQLRNPTGKYTPGLQVLSDGTAAVFPYYPNILPRKRLRISNVAGVRFIGWIKSWTPQTNGFPGASICVVQASDRLDALARVSLDTPIRQEVITDDPLMYWPLTDAADSVIALEQSGNPTFALYLRNPAQAALTFGGNGPGSGDGTGVLFAPSSLTAGQYLQTVVPTHQFSAATVEVWINPGLTLPTWQQIPFTTGFPYFYVTTAGNVGFTDGGLVVTGPSVYDGGWHHLAATRAVFPGSWTFYVDGVSRGTVASAQSDAVSQVTVGANTYGQTGGLYQGNVGQAAAYNTALSAARVLAHYNAGMGWSGETTSTRIARFLAYAGLTSSDWNLDTSAVSVGTYPQGGKDIATACQDMSTTEGGGSAFYVLNGTVRFANRAFRKAGAPTLTLDGVTDIDRSAFQPAIDDSTIANTSTASRATESGTQAQFTAQDNSILGSVARYGIATDDVTTYTATDLDALDLAQWIVAEGKWPAYRLPQITVDMLTAEHNLYATLQTIEIGSRIRVTNLPAGSAPASQLDLIVEGWTETVNLTTYTVTFDTSPADSPARMILNDTSYGRLQPTSDCSIFSAITASQTSFTITFTPGSTTFTTVSARYPMKIKIDSEVLTLVNPPGGSTSPQSFTGVLRGQDGTYAAAHDSFSVVNLQQAATLAL